MNCLSYGALSLGTWIKIDNLVRTLILFWLFNDVDFLDHWHKLYSDYILSIWSLPESLVPPNLVATGYSFRAIKEII